MKKISIILALVVATLVITNLSSCNYVAKRWGGTVTVQVPNNCVVVNATWKDNSLWVLYRDTTTNSLFFAEDSNFGILNGKVIFK